MNINMKITINSGSALILFIISFFGLTFLAAKFDSIERLYAVGLAGLAAAFGGFLVKRNSNNKITLEAEKAGVTSAKTGDPLN